MDFSRVELSEDDRHSGTSCGHFEDPVTQEVIERDRQTGENFDEGVHLALGEAGYLAADFNDEADGGFSRLQRRIWNLGDRSSAHAVVPLGHDGDGRAGGRAVRLARTQG